MTKDDVYDWLTKAAGFAILALVIYGGVTLVGDITGGTSPITRARRVLGLVDDPPLVGAWRDLDTGGDWGTLTVHGDGTCQMTGGELGDLAGGRAEADSELAQARRAVLAELAQAMTARAPCAIGATSIVMTPDYSETNRAMKKHASVLQAGGDKPEALGAVFELRYRLDGDFLHVQVLDEGKSSGKEIRMIRVRQ